MSANRPPVSHPHNQSTVSRLWRGRHGTERLFGREDDLRRIDEAWSKSRTHVLVIRAWGGVGKTSLVAHWMISRDVWNHSDFERVFDWSFYSQGTRERGAASAESFIAEALKYFGDERMAGSGASPWDKGARLAALVGDKRSLLVLDGLEPLQYPPGPLEGELKDPALEALLKGLAQRNAGLCIVTTRESVTDVKPFHETTTREWQLEHLSDESGAQLLFEAGVKRAGNVEIDRGDPELRTAAREVCGHALTLHLLGRYLARAHGGDIHRRDQVTFEMATGEIEGGHAFRMIAAYEKWLAQEGEKGVRQLAILRLLGLFDRPADADCLSDLRRSPPIPGLTEPLVELAEEDWNLGLSALADCTLISIHRDECASLSPQPTIDCHPLIREYFASQLRKDSLPAWHGGHRRLFAYLRAHSKKRPRQLLDMMVSFQAVMHGCHAGQYKRALALFRQRVRQKEKNVSVWRLGAFVADHATLRCFLTNNDRPSPCLSASAQAYVFNEIGADLRALGRFGEATTMIEAAVETQERVAQRGTTGYQRRAHTRLANYLGNKASLHMAIGALEEARQAAKRAVAAADASNSNFQRVSTRAALGHALHKMKEIAKARDLFDEATKYNSEWTTRLRALQGARYCALLLDLGQYEEVLAIANQNLPWTEKMGWRREVALERLNRGLALSYIAGPASPQAAEDLDAAVAILRQTGYQQYVPQALIARSSFHRRQSLLEHGAATDNAWKDLHEAYEIVHRTGHLLAECDALCLETRLWLDRSDKRSEGGNCVDRLRTLITQTGYELRNFDLSVLKTWVTILEGKQALGKEMLEQVCRETRAVGYKACDEDIAFLRKLLKWNIGQSTYTSD